MIPWVAVGAEVVLPLTTLVAGELKMIVGSASTSISMPLDGAGWRYR